MFGTTSTIWAPSGTITGALAPTNDATIASTLGFLPESPCSFWGSGFQRLVCVLLVASTSRWRLRRLASTSAAVQPSPAPMRPQLGAGPYISWALSRVPVRFKEGLSPTAVGEAPGPG